MADQSQPTIIREQSYNSIRQKYDLLVEMSDNLERLRFDQQGLQKEIDPEVYRERQDLLGTDKEIKSAEEIIVHSLQKVAQMIDYAEIEQAKADGILSEEEAENTIRIKREAELIQVRESISRDQDLER